MLEDLSALAIVPKARAIAARRLSQNDYDELMRRRSVIEVVAALKSHPYFEKSLAGLGANGEVHREQLEQALSKDIFFKYESLMRYSFREHHFGAFFLVRCEVNEILAKLNLLSRGATSRYIIQMPGFLASHTRFSLLKLAEAKSAQACVSVLAGTPYAAILRSCLPEDGSEPDYLACEHAFTCYYYDFCLRKLREDVHPRERAETQQLFECEAEIANLDIIFRAKAFFAESMPPERIRALLVPVYRVLNEKQLYALADTATLDEFLQKYNASRAAAYYGERTAKNSSDADVRGKSRLYATAEHLLRFSNTPQTVLAAVLCLADLERSNIINVVEGVRYGLPPEKIAAFLKNRKKV